MLPKSIINVSLVMRDGDTMEKKQKRDEVKVLSGLERTDNKQTGHGSEENVMAVLPIRSDSVRGYGRLPPMPGDVAATFATRVDAARTIAATKGNTLLYTLKFD